MKIPERYIELIIYKDFLLLKLFFMLIGVILLAFIIKLCKRSYLAEGYGTLEVFKIKNKYINWFWILCYIIIFVVILFILRIYRYNLSYDLKPLIMFFKLLYINKEFLGIFIIILYALCGLLLLTFILKNIKQFLILRLLKQHIVSGYPRESYIPYTIPPEERSLYRSLYLETLYWFDKVSHYKITSFIGDKIFPLELFLHKKNLSFWGGIWKLIRRLIWGVLTPQGLLLLLLYLFIKDCIENDFVIQTVFKIMPYYFIYVLWYNISYFYHPFYQLNILDNIIYELYYEYPNIIYHGLDEEEALMLLIYIRNGLQRPKDDKYINLGHIALRIKHYSRYKLVDKEKSIYYNENSGHFLTLNSEGKVVLDDENE